MVGAFPPPVHGMAVVNAAVREAVQQTGLPVLAIDIAAPSLDRSTLARLGRLPKVLRGLWRLIRQPGLYRTSLYISVSGGLGQLYEIAFLLLGKLRGMRIFLHHHSFAYLDRPNMLARVLVWAAGRRAVHITLSPGMAVRLQRQYRVDRAVAISNAVFFSVSAIADTARARLITLGFLSNIAPEKGVFEFLDLVAAARARGLPVRGKLAGPFQDAATEHAVLDRLRVLPWVEYVGPQHGPAKTAFFDSIDALIFPTFYTNEAEPVTLHEAMSRALPVIAYGRGCIPEILGTECGRVIDPKMAFLPDALAQLELWFADLAAFQGASQAAATRFADTLMVNRERWRALLTEISGLQDRPRVGG